MNKLICQKCGGEISNEFGVTLVYCTNCGAGVQSMQPEKTAVLGEVPTLVSPKSLINNSSSNSKMTRNVLGCLGLGVVLLSALGIFGYWSWSGKNLLAKYTKQYNCTIAGEPEPETSQDYYNRAVKHIEIFSGNSVTSLDDCAFGALSEAIRLDPHNANAFLLRGYGYRQKKQSDLALADYGKAIEIEPKASRSYYLRSKIYLEEEMFEKALADVSEAIRFKPDDENYYYDRVFIYRKLGKNDLAEADEQKHRELVSAKIEKTTTPAPSITSNNPSSTKTVSGGVINGKATNLVKPAYPAAARAVRASGAVNVQVTVDEKGDVISASAVSGHPLLRASAVQAARESKFSPTLLSGKAVKVTGVIVYNFVPE